MITIFHVIQKRQYKAFKNTPIKMGIANTTNDSKQSAKVIVINQYLLYWFPKAQSVLSGIQPTYP